MRFLQHLIAWVRERSLFVLLLVVLVVLLADLASHWGGHFWAEYRLHTARRAIERQDYAQAQEFLAQFLRYRPDSAEGHFLSARLARRTGDLVEAARHLQTCEKLGTLPRETLKLEQALYEVQQGNLNQEKYLQDCLTRQDTDSFLILEALSQGYTKRYQLSQALECLNRMLEEQPDNAYALTRRGWIQERFGNRNEALADYRHAVEVAPEHLLARRFLGDLLLHIARKPDEAAEQYEVLHERQPDDPALVANLAQCWLEMDRAEDARPLVGKALLAHPRDANLLLVRGLIAQKEGHLSPAETWLRQALASKPSLQPAFYALFLVLSQQGKNAEADKCQEQLNKVQADLKQMDDLVRRVTREPLNPQLRYEVARLLYKLGEDPEGDNWLRMALTLDPYHLAARQTMTERQQRGRGKPDTPSPLDQQGASIGLPLPPNLVR